MKKLHFLLSTFLVFIFTSCGEDELKGVVLSEDPGYVKEPLVAIQAEDGTGNWINGLIDQNSRVIALDFRILDDQSAVNVKLKLEGVSKCTPSVFYAQSPDFHKLGLCYYLKILYL